MPPHISVAIIDPDRSAARNLESYLNTIDQVTISGVAEDLKAGYEMVVRTKPMVVILDLDSDRQLSFEAIETICKSYPNTAVFAASSDSSSDTILSSMRCGATEFLLKPIEPTDLLNSLKKVGRLIVPLQRQEAPAKTGRIITCFSPKGGMGNTTVATNLAVSLHKATNEPVVLVDLDLESGDASMFLNLRTKYTISDVTSNIARLDQSFLESVLAKHESGIFLLAEPDKVEDAVGITPTQVREVLELLRGMFSYIVVDTEMGYGDSNLVAFDCADVLVLVGILNLPSIRNIQKALDVFDRMGYNRDKVKLIINRHVKKGEITLKDAEKTLNFNVFKSINNDYSNVMASINRGEPLFLLAPSSEISRSFKELAGDLLEYLGTSVKRARAH